jgi:hypothetical protein
MDSTTAATDALTRQFLAWIAARPRSYAEAIDAWRTTCPRLTIWEDAVSDGLVRVNGGGRRDQATVTITERGRALLNGEPGS